MRGDGPLLLPPTLRVASNHIDSPISTVNFYGSTGTAPAIPKIATYGLFNAVDTQTGKIVWRTKTPSIVVSGVAVAGDLVFWGRNDGTYLAQDARNGKTLWTWRSRLPGIGGANGAGAVYMVDGREFVVMPFGGNSHIRGDNGAALSPLGDAVIAFALPRNGSEPHIVDAHPVQIPVRAPANVAGTSVQPAGTKLVEIDAHDLNYYPQRFTATAGQKIAVRVSDTGHLPVGFAVDLPTGAIGLARPVAPGEATYFTFTAPTQPGNYEFFSSIQPDKYYARGGIMTVRAR